MMDMMDTIDMIFSHQVLFSTSESIRRKTRSCFDPLILEVSLLVPTSAFLGIYGNLLMYAILKFRIYIRPNLLHKNVLEVSPHRKCEPAKLIEGNYTKLFLLTSSQLMLLSVRFIQHTRSCHSSTPPPLP